MKTICICGAGTMGSGIAQVCASAGFIAILYDINEKVLEAARQKLEKDLQSLLDKGKITIEKKSSIQNNTIYTSIIKECIADIVIEAIIEKMGVKTALLKSLAGVNGVDTIFATNTSSLSITEISAAAGDPSRVAGLHFFNPAPVMKLVEVVKGEHTSADVIDHLVAFTKELGKVPVVCKDSPGFIVNRVARPFYIESLRLAEEGIISYEDLDKLLVANGFKLGPFQLMDLIGNDINYAVSCSVYEQLDKPDRLKPSYLQKEKVDEGHLGKKSGKGYYDYNT